MCGIAGIINWNKGPVIKDDLIKMNSFLKERGPDHQGYWIENNIGFAHSRLSIIDLSSLANQPMSDKDGLIWITYNGEIYNYKALQNELIGLGVKFKSNSDTEVLIYGFLEWGMDTLLKKLNGMFAFAIWDTRDMSSYFARDRFGQKPLYYFQNEKELLFSSDIRSIWSIKRSSLNLDYDSLDYYLSELSTPQPKTIWKEIKQVKPANYYKFQNGKIVIEHKYWDLDYSPKINISFEEAVEETERLLTQAILRRTVSDVPIGAFLSGGVDSGLVCSLLAKNSSEPINTYSVGFEDNELNELNEARIVAQKYDTNHTEIIANSDITNILDDLVNYFGEPFADDSNIPTYLICKEVKKYSKVVLSGDGGDELFGGYHEYHTAFKTDEYLKISPKVYRNIKTVFDKLFYHMSSNKNSFNLGHLKAFSKQKPYQFLNRKLGFDFNEINSLYVKGNNYTQVALGTLWEKDNHGSLVDRLLSNSLNTRLLNSYLVKTDRSSMKSSLELRSPFLDYELADFASKVPSSHLFHNCRSKAITKSLSEKHFDININKRPKKGFGLPLTNWLCSDLSEQIEYHLISYSSLNEIGIETSKVLSLVNQFKKFNFVPAEKIWTLLCLDKWLKIYL